MLVLQEEVTEPSAPKYIIFLLMLTSVLEVGTIIHPTLQAKELNPLRWPGWAKTVRGN